MSDCVDRCRVHHFFEYDARGLLEMTDPSMAAQAGAAWGGLRDGFCCG
jgi:hypothetical protein